MMKTFLFAWNPKNWDWETLDDGIKEIDQKGYTTEKWSVLSHKKISIGDRAFLVRLGKEPKGIMASGFVKTSPFLSEHWNGTGKLVHRVLIDFDVILKPDKESLLSIDILNQGELASCNWTPQASGVEISSEFTEELEAVWFDFLSMHENQKKFSYSSTYPEGNFKLNTITRYERNPRARKACIEHYGLICCACGFNFEKTYGTLGKDFIHIHHLKQLSDIKEEYEVDPIEDLRPLCPNCHAMIHREREPLKIEKLRDIIAQNKSI